MAELILLSLIAAVISLDITAFGQFMISRPIFCAPLFGYLMGDIKSGLWIGMIVELIWVRMIPMGAAIPQDVTSIAILSTIWGLRAAQGVKGSMVVALILAVPAGILFQRLDIMMRYYNVRISHWVEEGIITGNESVLGRGIAWGMFMFAAKAFIFYLLLIYPGAILVRTILARMPEYIFRGFEVSWWLLPMAGFGVFFASFRKGKFPC